MTSDGSADDRGGRGPAPVRVLVVDDQGMVRTGFSAFLAAQDDIVVVGEAADGRHAVQQAAMLRPDVILMDIRMPEMDGLAATRAIVAGSTSEDPGPRIVVLTTFDLDDYVYEALRSGASGFLLKDASAAELATAVRIVAAGDAVIAPSVTRRLIRDFAAAGARPAPSGDRLGVLTERETEVLGLVARAMSNGEIAEALVLAEQTVKTHVSRIFMKLDLRDRAQAIVFAYESGLVSPGA